ncbi:MAG: type II secretion system F family protein [Alcanivorax sp.]|nr:type II secretion system F family protein [Alcanivorax sp.]
MANFWIALLLALASLWIVLVKSRGWERRQRVLTRLAQGEQGAEEDGRNLLLASISRRLTSSAFVRDDYQEIYSALKLTGRNAEKIQVIYFISCWLLPLFTTIVGLLWAGFAGALLLGAAGFILPRRYIRAVAGRARHRQNLEAIEFAQVLRMLLEAGLSIERGFRIAALQARPLIPTLAYRLDRFNRLMDSGADRSAALDDIGAGKDIPVLHNLTRLLKQAGALGGSAAESIEQIIIEGQDIERSRIKEQVNKIGVKMTIIMMTIMLPALFIIIGGPAGISIMNALTQ